MRLLREYKQISIFFNHEILNLSALKTAHFHWLIQLE